MRYRDNECVSQRTCNCSHYGVTASYIEAAAAAATTDVDDDDDAHRH